MIRRVSAMLLMLVWALPALAVEQAGQVIFVAGTVTVERPESTKLKKTDPVFEGDVIVTAARSRGQLLMKDGAKFSLRANTRFAVEEYFLAGEEREQPDGSVVVASDSSAVASLVKGGFRTISGAIGNDDPEQYAVKSPAATMGIRGTHYSAVLCSGDCAVPEGEPPPDGLYVGVTDGVVSISNDTGEYTVNPGEYYYVESFESTPVQLPEPPGILDEGADEAGTADEESEEESDEESTDESGEEADEEGSEDGEDSGDESAEEDAGEGSEESADGEESAAAEESAAGDESGAAADSGESTDGQAADGSAEQSATAAAEVAETADALGQTTSESVGLDSSPDAGPPGETFSSRSTAPPGESPGGTAPDTSGEGEEGAAAEEEATADSSGDAPAGEESTASTDSGSGSGSTGSGGSSSFGDAGAGSGSAATGGSTAPPPSEPPIPV
ncbi:MAG: FecR domain-containing protein, partial [Gammaproteobacteria bacterium]|nr:FecR domain-containing protein [Gammaproteobacteria bacterium]